MAQQAQTQTAKTDGFGFSAALICLKDGEAVARYGWNGGQFVVMMGGLHLPQLAVNAVTARWIHSGMPLDCNPCFLLHNAQKQWQPGWVPSTGDLLAEDWYVVQVQLGVGPA